MVKELQNDVLTDKKRQQNNSFGWLATFILKVVALQKKVGVIHAISQRH